MIYLCDFYRWGLPSCQGLGILWGYLLATFHAIWCEGMRDTYAQRNTPLKLAILNQVDRFNLAIGVIDRVPKLQISAAHTKQWLQDQLTECVAYAHAHGIDAPEQRDWTWS